MHNAQSSFGVDLTFHELVNILEKKHPPLVLHSHGSQITNTMDGHDLESIKMVLDVTYNFFQPYKHDMPFPDTYEMHFLDIAPLVLRFTPILSICIVCIWCSRFPLHKQIDL
jgi:hypothetical protein